MPRMRGERQQDYLARKQFAGTTSPVASSAHFEREIATPVACRCSARPYPHAARDENGRVIHNAEPMRPSR